MQWRANLEKRNGPKAGQDLHQETGYKRDQHPSGVSCDEHRKETTLSLVANSRSSEKLVFYS